MTLSVMRSSYFVWFVMAMIHLTESFTCLSTSMENHGRRKQLKMVPAAGSAGTYRPFAEYAWEKILSSGLVAGDEGNVPDHLATNSSPAKGSPVGTNVNIEVRSAVPKKRDDSGETMPLRMARYALLETITTKEEDPNVFLSVSSGIQVLNLVLFPDTSLPLPVLGMDLVTLPGGKNLIAIDFQPILPPTRSGDDKVEDNETSQLTPLFPSPYEKYEDRIQRLYEKHVSNQSDVLPWGGDIPPQAKRFFSPYALWTRLKGEEGLDTIQNEVYKAFCDYFDLYLEIMIDSKSHSSLGISESKEAIKGGHIDYLNYRRDNDPARPMLTRLYGSEYTEELIEKVLFQMI